MNANILYSNNQIDYDKDLCEYIPGLYRLIDLCKDDYSKGFVDKTIVSIESLKKLCNNMVPLSFKSISDVNFTKLNSISFRLIGCYGNHTLIARLLLNKKIIRKKIYDLLIISQPSMDKSSLSPGIYLLLINPNLGLIIHWPEMGCYEANVYLQHKKNMVNLHRYLTKLTDHQLCFMSEEDLASFDWHLEYTNDDEQDDFKIRPGFKVNLPHKIKTEINNQMKNVSLYPIVVEYITHQSFIIRQLINTASHSYKITSPVSTTQFPIDLRNKLKDHYLHFDRHKMNIYELKLFVKYGLEMKDELFSPLRKALAAAKKRHEIKEHQEISAVIEDIEIMNQIAMMKLHSYYGHFDISLSKINISDANLNRIQTKYPEVESLIEEKVKINSKNWKSMKKRYNLACIIIGNIFEKTSKVKKNDDRNAKSMIETLYDMFADKETDLHKLMEKYTQQSILQNSASACDLINYNNLNNSNLNKAKQMTKNMLDAEFVQKLVNSELFEGHDDIKEKIKSAFFEEYHEWKKNIFPHEIRKILPKSLLIQQLEYKLEKEYEEEKQKIEKKEFERICDDLEYKYKNGSMRLSVLNVIESYNYFIINYEIEMIQPNQLQISIYELSLEKRILMDHICTSFHIDSQVYDFRKISQFDNKFLLILYNKKMLKIEIFFDNAQQLALNFKSHLIIKPFKILNTDENFIIAINEPKGLLAIYNTKEVKLDVFSFDDNRSRLYGRNANIQLSPWYNNNIPNIRYFLFIKNTEELCFVENNGRARIFNLVYLQFQPTMCNFPSNLMNVLSSSDGSYIMAITKEILQHKPDVDSIISTDIEKQHDYNSDIKEINRAYVYYHKNFSDLVRKVIDLPLNFKSSEFLQMSCVNSGQTHLISLDLQNGCLNSLLVKITPEKSYMRKKLNDLINVYKSMFEKYPINTCINPIQNCPLSLKIVLDISDDDNIEEYTEKFEKYISLMFKNLKDSTKKPASILKKFSTSVITFQECDVENANFQKKFLSEYQLGEWIIQLCYLIPIQIAVVRNNLFQSLKDGLSLNENYLSELKGGQHVDIMAKSISLGWYEGIFKHFGNKKVKVVSSMGEQSCGKSFMLNHLVGTSFDGSAMRCSAGIWMSLVNTKEYIYVVLYFEGLKSPKRKPQEDMLLTFFNTIVSDLILFKNQYTINENMSTIFQKFQDSVKLFESIPKMLQQTRLCIIIKDVPMRDKDGVSKEVQSILGKILAEKGENNFITRMYGGKVEILPWPIFNDIAWFESLSKIKTNLDKQESKYENAITFLQNTKTIMAKLEILDLNSLNKSLIL
ncbi:hypothetical protein GLOIN_2v1781565 [Rhizophagus clarus]|uniref:VLIG-type G domain-containing protein n=1 Tax=Rhizophagus clarus TaxID=94130 RepID=A0A8H3KZJ7_9GLOM|nr:hypothetical protein GLOIN_2v1781565 [Rhizophagus clarus]